MRAEEQTPVIDTGWIMGDDVMSSISLATSFVVGQDCLISKTEKKGNKIFSHFL